MDSPNFFNKSILVVYSEKQTKVHLEVVEGVKILLEKGKFNFKFILANKLDKSFFKNVSLVISIGGDGTFIRASHYMKDQLICGINSEREFSEGALTSFDEKNYFEILRILEGNFKVHEKNRIEIKKNGKLVGCCAINEVFVGSKYQFYTSKYVLEVGDLKEEQRSSGVLIVTPLGSGAWYKSAGGKSFSTETLKYLVREPFSGKLFNPKLLKGEIKSSIKFYSLMHEEGVVVLDSNKIYPFTYKDIIELSLSKKPLKIIKVLEK